MDNMNLRSNLQDIYRKMSSSETLLRLLYYQTNPLDTSNQNIIGSQLHSDVVDTHLFWTPKTTDLTNTPTCRICLYAGNRSPLSNNYMSSDQDFVFDIYVHIDDFDRKDLRLTWIADEVNKLISMTRVTGMGKIQFVSGSNIFSSPDGYVGYRLVYQFGSGN